MDENQVRLTTCGAVVRVLLVAGCLGSLGGCDASRPPSASGPRPLGTRVYFAGPTRAVEFNHNSQPVLVFWFDCDGDPKALKSIPKDNVIPGARGVVPGDRNGGWRVGGSEKGGLATLNSEVRTQNGRQVDFDWATSDGRSGTIRIDGQPYDIAKGDLFLVSTRSDPIQVRQIHRNFRTHRLTGDDFLKGLAKNDSDVVDFIAAATPPTSIREF